MAIYCHVCASTKGPFLVEPIPAGITSHPSIVRCQSCTFPFAGVTVANKANTKENFAYWFLECNKCKALFYSLLEGIPCAQSHFGVNSCPQCGNPFPPVDEVCIRKDDDGLVSVLKFRPDAQALADVKLLFDKVARAVPQHPNLVAVIREIMLVQAYSGFKSYEYEIWVAHIADIRGEKTISHMLQEAMEKKFFSTSSQLLKFAREEKGLNVLESIKIQKS